MIDDNIYDIELVDNITSDLLKIFSSSNEFLIKSECHVLLNIIFETLFDEKLKTKNFNYIFNLLANDELKIYKKDLEPVTIAFIICFNVNYITNTDSFNDKVCIKIGKHLLPISYYIKKNHE